MFPSLFTLAYLTVVLAAGNNHGASLMAAAAAAGRPPECSTSRRAISKGPTVWERARVPNLQRYCDLVARAHAQLASNPDAARQSAKVADEALPGHAAPAVILARAALALGLPKDAEREFERARKMDPRSVEDPATLHDFARTLQKTGKLDEALTMYRALVPRIDLLGSMDRRVSVLIEAAHVSMARAGSPKVDASSKEATPKESVPRNPLDEAITYLREARQRPPTQLAGDVLLSLVLVLDRAGDKAQADAALGDANELGAQARVFDYLAVEEDKLALQALSVERSDPSLAIETWEAFLEGAGGKGPWAQSARARLEALRKSGTKTRTNKSRTSERRRAP